MNEKSGRLAAHRSLQIQERAVTPSKTVSRIELGSLRKSHFLTGILSLLDCRCPKG